jgi:hypothetical protein
MPQPSTQRPILDSFLPQFAATSDEQTSREIIPAGERDDLGHPALGGRTNGHFAAFDAAFEAEEFVGPLGHASAGTPNGTPDNPVIDQAVAPTPGANGNGFSHVNGTAKAESGAIESTLRAAVSEVLATAASRSSAAHVNGAAEIEIGEPAVPPAPAIQLPSDEEPSDPREQVRSQTDSAAVAEHPAAGSCFTPYLVTEIRELRNRCKRRRWWRRLFG